MLCTQEELTLTLSINATLPYNHLIVNTTLAIFFETNQQIVLLQPANNCLQQYRLQM